MLLNEKGVEVFARRRDEFLSLAGKLDGGRDAERPLEKGCQFNHDNGKKISCFYINARKLRNKFVELPSCHSRKTSYNVYNGDMGKEFYKE